jgi:hypothetical protein
MREGGQRTQPLGIRREARLSPSQTCSIPSSSVSRARCGNGFARSSSPSIFHWVQFWTVTLRCLSAAHKRLVASTAVRLLKRAEPAGARAGESPAGSFGLTRLGLSQKSMPPLAGPGGLWHNTSADIVHDASCGQIMPYPRGETGRALSNPTLHTPKGPSSKPPTRAAPRALAAARRRR